MSFKSRLSGAVSRRSFLGAASAMALSCAAQSGPVLPAAEGKRKRIAAIITEYRLNSHADVIVGRLLEGYHYYGVHRAPSVRVVSLYTDQVPKNDLSRVMAAKHRVPIRDSIREALVENGKLAVEGVVIIGEHGNYPFNEKGQHLYPRHELFRRVVEAFREAGEAVPVFCDKHLSYDWEKARQMYDWSRELRFPLLAGSSLPLAWRTPPLELERESRIEHAVACFYGGKESYGFHALESLQCMVERRKDGETGISAVQCIEGPAVWTWSGANPWAVRLLDAALSRCPDRKPGSPRDTVREPILFVLEYRDGLRAAVYLLNGHTATTGFAADVAGSRDPVSTQIELQSGRPFGHFSPLVYYIERMMLTGKPAYPVERTLLTTGALAALMDSSWQKGRRLETPHLAVAYTAPRRTLYNRGPMPPLERT
jgi:hypothetical protein